MPDYKKLYLTMFNAATDAVEKLACGDGAGAEAILIAAQQRCEDMYIEEADDEPEQP